MRTWGRLLVASVLGLLFAGCGAAETEGDDVAGRMEADFGGPSGLMEFFDTHSDDEIMRALVPYGVRYSTAALITDCPQYFPSGDRNVWHSVSQGNVGNWGDAESPSNDYDGGHLIGSQLGGWGKRANLVPQDANFNRGNWAVLENKMARCGVLPSGRLSYTIGGGYPNSTTLIPSTMTMEIRNRYSGAGVLLSFQNVDYGGWNGTSEKNRGVTFLTNQGCN